MRLLGPEAGLAMRSVEVPPGSLVLAHRDLFHRGGRAVEGATARLAMGGRSILTPLSVFWHGYPLMT